MITMFFWDSIYLYVIIDLIPLFGQKPKKQPVIRSPRVILCDIYEQVKKSIQVIHIYTELVMMSLLMYTVVSYCRHLKLYIYAAYQRWSSDRMYFVSVFQVYCGKFLQAISDHCRHVVCLNWPLSIGNVAVSFDFVCGENLIALINSL